MNPLLLKLVPYIGVAAIIGGAWFYHDRVTDGLKEQLVEATAAKDKAVQLRKDDQILYANAQIDAAKNYREAQDAFIDERVKQEARRADANLRLARQAKRDAEAARINLLAFEQEFAAHVAVCELPESIKCLLAVAAGADHQDGYSCAGVPKASAADTAPGPTDGSPEASL